MKDLTDRTLIGSRILLILLFFNMLVCAYSGRVGWMLFWAIAFSSGVHERGYEIAQCFRCGKFAVIGEDLQLRMPTTDEQLAINTSAHLTESQIVWASFTGARRK